MSPYLDQLQYADEPGKGPWRLYVLDRDGYHRGGKFFQGDRLPVDDEERRYWLTRQAAQHDAIQSLRQGLEVRITDGGDRLVFHAKGTKHIYPPDPYTFWNTVGGA